MLFTWQSFNITSFQDLRRISVSVVCLNTKNKLRHSFILFVEMGQLSANYHVGEHNERLSHSREERD